jgi:hypothetical protein
MSNRQYFGPLAVFIATHDKMGRRLPKSQHHPFISDGCFGELYEGDSAGARELAAHLLAAADAYDELAATMRKVIG